MNIIYYNNGQLKCLFLKLAAPTIGFSRNVYTVGESEGLFAVSVVLELPEPLPGQTVELEVLALDSTAICKHTILLV